MNKVPKLNVSGLRGIWPNELNEKIIAEYVSAFARFIRKKSGKKILLARDGRASGLLISDIIIKMLAAEGMETTDGGILPTPTVIFSAREMKFDGAVIITASHNPIEYNGLKFINGKGLFTNESEIREIESLRVSGLIARPLLSSPTTKLFDNTLISQHIKAIADKISVSVIRARRFKVAADPVNASSCLATPELLRELGCESFIINGEPTGVFGRPPEPLPANITDLARAVLENKANIGFAQDPDADRLVIVDEKGQALSEELTLALAVESVLSRSDLKGAQGPTLELAGKGRTFLDSQGSTLRSQEAVVVNLSTSRVIDDIAEKHGARTWRTKIGEANVVQGILKHKAIIGGEGNGGVIYPAINLARDSLVGMALVLELLAARRKSVSEIVTGFPRYFSRKEKFPFGGDLNNLYEKFLEKFSQAQANKLDGLRLDFPNKSWLHIRPSNTEPVLRVIAEAPKSAALDDLFSAAAALVRAADLR